MLAVGGKGEREHIMEENLLYFQDEAGNELPLQLVNTYDVEDQCFALLVTPDSELKDDEMPSYYIMKAILEDGQIVNFEMPTDEEMEKVVPVISQQMEHNHGCSSCDSCPGCGSH